VKMIGKPRIKVIVEVDVLGYSLPVYARIDVPFDILVSNRSGDALYDACQQALKELGEYVNGKVDERNHPRQAH